MAVIDPLSRRMLLFRSGGAALFALSGLPLGAIAAESLGRKKFAFILQRGAADGLALLAPVGDPQFEAARGALAQEEGRYPVDRMFSLHPGFAQLSKLAAAGDALLFHAVGLSHPTRSHFDAQNLLETGGRVPYAQRTGVMNRLLGLGSEDRTGLALAHVVPPALQGARPTSSYALGANDSANADLYARIAGMYAGDPALAATWREALATRSVGEAAQRELGENVNQVGAMAADFLSRSDDYDLVMIESTGWDTHSNQANRLAHQVGELDAIIGALCNGLGEQWSDTLIIVASEFGRTVAVNGNGGTDHGTGGTLFALGGALPRAGVIADWPGLAGNQLYENRDLRTTSPVEAVIAGLAAAHFGVDPRDAARTLYPDLDTVSPVRF